MGWVGLGIDSICTDWLGLGADMICPVQSSLSHEGTSWPLSGVRHRNWQILTRKGYVRL